MTTLDDFRSGSTPVKTLSYWLAFLMAQPWILAGSAWGAYVDETASQVPAAVDDSYNFAVADVDGANGPDVLVANRGQSSLWMNDGSGSFTDDTAARLPAALHTTLAIATGDFDGVNGPDAILVGDGQNRIYMNDGSGVFSDETGARLPSAQRVSVDVAVADLDADGDLDIVVANRRSANRVLINDGSGNFTDQSAARIGSESELTYGVALGDVDDNGSPDILFGNFAGQNRLLLNNNLGFFTDVSATNLPAETNTTGGVALVDVNGDDQLDIASAEGGNGVGLLLNDGSGSFAAGGSVPAIPEFAIRVRGGDTDFDGDQDLVIATMGQDRLFINDSTGVFADQTASEIPADDRRSFGLQLFDADADLDLDVVAATPQGQNRYLDNAIAAPRILIDVSPDYIENTDTVTIDVTAFDEDGVSSLDVFVIEPSAPATEIPATPLGGSSWQYTVAEIGTHTVRVRASDGVNNSEKETYFDALANDVTPPTVSLAFNPTTITQGESVDFTITASDDREVDALTLTVDGINVPLDSSGEATYVPASTGALAVVATAEDAAGNSATDSSTLTVNPDTVPPVVSLSATPASLDITNPISITASATDNIVVDSFEVVVNGPTGVPADTPVPLDGGGNGSYTPYIPGTYTFSAIATDGAANTTTETADVLATGIVDTEAPQVSVSVVPGTTTPGGSVTITVNATDNIFVLSRSATVNGAPLTLDGSHQATFTAPVLGTYTVIAEAADPTGNIGSDTVSFDAVDPATDVDPPVVAISSPGEGDALSGVVDIIGTVTDLTLVSYELSIRPAGTGAFMPFHTASVQRVDDVLGALDTTLYENGIYEIRLVAGDVNALMSSVVQTVTLEGEFKPGMFTITYEDLNVPVSGIPITIKRTYDSRRRGIQGDFGYGWELEVVQDAVYSNNRVLGEGWTGLPGGGILGLPCGGGIREDLYHVTEVRFSDAEFYKFQFQITLTSAFLGGGYCEVASVSFTQIGGVPGAQLIPLNVDAAAVGQGNLVDTLFNVVDVEDVRLITLDGRRYELSLDNGLKNITDINGNTVFINNNGIVHSSGKSVSFTRDGSGRITAITDPLGRSINYTYDGSGDLVTSTDRATNTTTYAYLVDHYLNLVTDPLGNIPMRNEYDSSGRLIAQVDALNNRTEFDWDLENGTQTITDRDGTVSVMTYDVDGNLDSANIGGTENTYTHDANGNKLTETNADGHTTTWTYDSLDRPTSQTDAEGNTTSFTYVGNQMTAIGDSEGNVLALNYDGSGNLTEQRDAGGNLMQGFAYDGSGNITQVTLAAGPSTMGYDASGNVTSVVAPGGRTETYTYDAMGNRLTAAVARTSSGGGSPVNETTAFTYDNNGRVLTMTDPLGNVTSFTYDGKQRKASETDANGNTTSYSYDSRGNLSRIDHPDSTFEVFGYDLTNRRTGHTDRGGNTTFYEYDNNDRLTRTIYPDGGSLTNAYSDGGALLSETDGRGNAITYTRDAIGRIATRTDENGGVTTHTYTGNHINPTTVTDPLGRVTTYSYDDSMLMTEYLVQTTLPDASIEQQTWGPNSRRTSFTDANGNTTTYAYDAAGNLTSVTTADGGITSYTYDEVGNRLTQVDAELRTTSYSYDALGRMLTRSLPGGASESWTYDGVGNVLTHTDFNGDTTAHTYDSMNRLTQTTFPGAATESYAYTANGELLTVTRGTDITTFTYDAMGRIASSATPDGTTLTYTYDNAGNRLTIGGLGARSFSYDVVDRLATVTDPVGVTTYGYDAAGNIIDIAYPNGTSAELSYNNRNQTVDVTHLAPDGTTELARFDYTTDGVGNRTKIIADGAEIDYVYDAINRLIQVIEDPSGANLTTEYGYDDVGNILTFTDPGGSETFTYDVNDRILTAGGSTFGYDANGNLLQVDEDGDAGTTDDIITFAYDSLNRLVERVEADGTTTEFEYDYAGNRIARTVDGTRREFVNDNHDPSGLSRVLRERTGGGTTVAEYHYGHGLLSMDRGGTDSFFHTDALGSVAALSSSAGAVTDTYSYDAYGNLVLSTGSTTNEYGFAGGRQDPSTGMYHLGARYFDPEIARFISRDPFPGLPENPATRHPYQYALNNPVNMIDPNGEFGMVSISISISIVSTLSSIAFNSYKTGKDVSDKLTDLLITIPGLPLNKEATADQLGAVIIDTPPTGDERKLEDLVKLGGGAVEKSYSVVYSMTSTFGKVVSLIHARNSALWMKHLPPVDNIPGKYLSCGFNAYVQKTYSLSQITSLAKGGKLKTAAEIIGAWLAYFNFLVLVVETVNDGPGNTHPTSCPSIPTT